MRGLVRAFRLFAASILLVSSSAHAYRPFDNTDADTAKAGEVELEVGAIGFTRSEGQSDYSPLFVFNYGFSPGYEFVAELQNQLILGPAKMEPRESVGSMELSVKHVLRPGVLQDQEGPSVALEVGSFLPSVPSMTGGTALQRRNGFGAIATVIASQRFGLATLHFNFNVALQRDGNFWMEPALVAEGPASWVVRPVVEVLYGHEFGGPNEASVLAGLIWTLRETLSIDAGVRAGREALAPLYELRCGFTISF